jgi:hypothetical protein
MPFCDLHIHTSFSDGIHRPTEVVEMCKHAGLAALAITDHDSVEGVEEASHAGESLGLEVIPGVEISADNGPLEIHLLGYFLDFADPGLNERLITFRDERKRRAERMLKRLEEADVHVEMEAVLRIAGDGTVGRPHIAEALVEKGYVDSVREAFERYIGKESPYYVPKYKMTPREAIQFILEFGGVPVYAHPGVNGPLRQEVLLGLVEAGLKGIEVWHPEHSQHTTRSLAQIADKNGLVKTGGTDFHGENISSASIGSIKIPLSTVEALKGLADAARTGRWA